MNDKKIKQDEGNVKYKPIPESIKKKLTIQTRDENIAIAERRGLKGSDSKPGNKGPTREDIEKTRKAKFVHAEKKHKYPLIKPMEKIEFDKDEYLTDKINQSYILNSQRGETLKNKGDKKRTSLRFTHCKDCPRLVYYEFHQPEKTRPYTVKGLVFFDEGQKSHKNIQNRLEEHERMLGSEGYLFIEEINANGFFDGIVPVEEKDGYLLVDIFELKDKFSGAVNSINQDDYDQAQLYFYAAEKSEWFKAKKYKPRAIRFVYRDRTLMTDDIFFGFMVKKDPDRQTDIMNYMRFLWNEVAAKKALVPHPYERKSTKCQYCRFYNHCWREYPELVKENEESDKELEAVDLPPEQEIFNSYAKRIFEILTEQKKAKEEIKQLEKVLLAYFKQTGNKIIPVNNEFGIGVRQSKLTEWDFAKLRETIGHEYYSKVSKPNASLVTDLINREYIDAGKFEQFKTYKLSKPSIYLKKI